MTMTQENPIVIEDREELIFILSEAKELLKVQENLLRLASNLKIHVNTNQA